MRGRPTRSVPGCDGPGDLLLHFFAEHKQIETRQVLEFFAVPGDKPVAVLNGLSADPDILNCEQFGGVPGPHEIANKIGIATI